MTFFATSVHYTTLVSYEKSTMAQSTMAALCTRVRERSRFSKYVHVATIEKSTMPHGYKDAPICVARRTFSQNSLSDRSRWPRSAPRMGLALLICRARDVARTTRHARHVTHDTSRTTRSRHGARGSVLEFPVGVSAPLRFTPPTSDFEQ